MTSNRLGEQEEIMLLWAKDRLGEREAVEWAIAAIKQNRGNLGDSTEALLSFLSKTAQERVDLADDLKAVWRLLHLSAKDSKGPSDSFMLMHDLKREIRNKAIMASSIDNLVECYRPRLTAGPRSDWMQSGPQAESSDALNWVHWSFEVLLRSSYGPSSRLTHADFDLIPDVLLTRLLERADFALSDALDVARQIRWLDDDHDLPNHLVHRVYIPPSDLTAVDLEQDDADGQVRDPDQYNRNFAPLIRLITATMSELAKRNPVPVRSKTHQWRTRSEGLYLRLFAFAGWDSCLVDSKDVFDFLGSLSPHAFWRWPIFPEIATTRAIRWNDFEPHARSALEARLVAGPQRDAFLSDVEVPASTFDYHRAYELSRLLDNDRTLSAEARQIVASYRLAHPEFPAHVPLVEKGLEGPQVRWVPKGKPDRFSDTPASELLATLANSEPAFGEGDDVEAFAETLSGKLKLLEALSDQDEEAEFFVKGWELLLSHSSQLKDDGRLRATAERIASAAHQLSEKTFNGLFERLSYWLDDVDEKCPRIEGSESLWLLLLPYAASLANDPAQKDKWSGSEIDLSMAALNEPLGHLLSIFIRRCADIPTNGDAKKVLPSEFVGPLKRLTGRARELLANRMVVAISYFEKADRAWLDELVISPMMQDAPESDRLWEAYAKYSRIMPPTVWAKLQEMAFRQLISPRLSPEAKDQLANQCVIIWVWSKERTKPFKVGTASLRSALGLANDDVRAAAAWQFAHFFYGHHDEEERLQNVDARDEDYSPPILWARLGPSFFNEIWPLEPTLQSPESANNFARIPAGVGPAHFKNAVETVLPYLVPFEVWSVLTEFRLDPSKGLAKELAQANPLETLILLAVCINPKQKHGVHDLAPILDWIVEANPDLKSDYRVRALRNLAA